MKSIKKVPTPAAARGLNFLSSDLASSPVDRAALASEAAGPIPPVPAPPATHGTGRPQPIAGQVAHAGTDVVPAMLTPREAVLNRNGAEVLGRGKIRGANAVGNELAAAGVDLPSLRYKHYARGTDTTSPEDGLRSAGAGGIGYVDPRAVDPVFEDVQYTAPNLGKLADVKQKQSMLDSKTISGLIGLASKYGLLSGGSGLSNYGGTGNMDAVGGFQGGSANVVRPERRMNSGVGKEMMFAYGEPDVPGRYGGGYHGAPPASYGGSPEGMAPPGYGGTPGGAAPGGYGGTRPIYGGPPGYDGGGGQTYGGTLPPGGDPFAGFGQLRDEPQGDPFRGFGFGRRFDPGQRHYRFSGGTGEVGNTPRPWEGIGYPPAIAGGDMEYHVDGSGWYGTERTFGDDYTPFNTPTGSQDEAGSWPGKSLMMLAQGTGDLPEPDLPTNEPWGQSQGTHFDDSDSGGFQNFTNPNAGKMGHYDPQYGYGGGGPTQRGIGLAAGTLSNLFVPGSSLVTGPLSRFLTRLAQRSGGRVDPASRSASQGKPSDTGDDSGGGVNQFRGFHMPGLHDFGGMFGGLPEGFTQGNRMYAPGEDQYSPGGNLSIGQQGAPSFMAPGSTGPQFNQGSIFTSPTNLSMALPGSFANLGEGSGGSMPFWNQMALRAYGRGDPAMGLGSNPELLKYGASLQGTGSAAPAWATIAPYLQKNTGFSGGGAASSFGPNARQMGAT